MTMLSLATVLAESARKRPDKIAVIDHAERLTSGELWQQTLAYAGGLRELGIGPGDVVANNWRAASGFGSAITSPCRANHLSN